ncbi:MAG TPA: SpoIIE family protein phosphatase [Acidimicrobiales bacterium]|nr:SpoIIE family protein phosphatase [Acidimicrobiales bacterium]
MPFGSSVLTLAISPTSPLTGRWSEFLPWGILVVGLLFTIGLVVMTERLVRRRQHAERLADENRRMYGEQRNVAVTLQRSLLPKVLPAIDGVQFAAGHIPGESGIEVGGDWYSAIAIDDPRFAFVIGDVSGGGWVRRRSWRGSATRPGRMRQSLQPGTDSRDGREGDQSPTDGHFATVLVGLVDSSRREATMANAGHLPVLLLHGDENEFARMPTGVPLGLRAPVYESVTLPIAPHSTLLAYTDGLVERRREDLDVGMERLRKAASVVTQYVDDLVAHIVDEIFGEHGSDDDTAILAIRWLD